MAPHCTRGWVTQKIGASVVVVLNSNPFLEAEKNCFVGLPLCIAVQRPLAQSDVRVRQLCSSIVPLLTPCFPSIPSWWIFGSLCLLVLATSDIKAGKVMERVVGL